MGKVSRKHDRQRQARQASSKTTIVRRVHSNATGSNSEVQRSHDRKDRLKSRGTRRSAGVAPNAQPGRSEGGKVPFGKNDRVLLVGEGDFSFTLALVQQHKVRFVVATSFDTREGLLNKYPHAKAIIESLSGTGHKFGGQSSEPDEFRGFSPSPPSSPILPPSAEKLSPSSSPTANASAPQTVILHSIDGTKLSGAHRKVMRRHGSFTKIVFNFPHVGGLSTDVNRQTRTNQQLIQGFFKAAKDLLASPGNPVRTSSDLHLQEDKYDSDDTGSADDASSSESGQILVTLFTGEAYADWNIRDIARSQGLRVVESFKFPWHAYPGYRHARTIGEVKTGRDRSEDGKRKGAWRGEEREARCLCSVFRMRMAGVI